MSEIVKCIVCGKEIKNPRANAKCCSQECSREYHKIYSRKYMKDRYNAKYKMDEEFRQKYRENANNRYAKLREQQIKYGWEPHVAVIRKIIEDGGSDEDVLEYITSKVKAMPRGENA